MKRVIIFTILLVSMQLGLWADGDLKSPGSFEIYAKPGASLYTGGAGYSLDAGVNIQIMKLLKIQGVLEPIIVNTSFHMNSVGELDTLKITSLGGALGFGYSIYLPKLVNLTITPQVKLGGSNLVLENSDGVFLNSFAFYLSLVVDLTIPFPMLENLILGLSVGYNMFFASTPIQEVNTSLYLGWKF